MCLLSSFAHRRGLEGITPKKHWAHLMSSISKCSKEPKVIEWLTPRLGRKKKQDESVIPWCQKVGNCQKREGYMSKGNRNHLLGTSTKMKDNSRF